MYRALYRQQIVTPLTYFVLSQINSVTKPASVSEKQEPELICRHRSCHVPVHFYGYEAARRKILGLRPTAIDRFLRFDHFDGQGKGCPLRSTKKRTIKDEALRAALENQLTLDFGEAPRVKTKIEFDPALICYVLGVWAHMYDGHALSFETFLEAKKAAEEDHLLDLRGLEPWRSPYALALAVTVKARDGRQLKLVPEQVVKFPDHVRRKQFALKRALDEAELEFGGNREKPARLYVVDVENLTPFSGPHIVTKEKTDTYARKAVNVAWAERLMTSELNFG